MSLLAFGSAAREQATLLPYVIEPRRSGAVVVSVVGVDSEGVVVSLPQATVVAGRLRSLADDLGLVVGGLDVDGLVGSEAARLTGLFAEIERLAMAGKTLMAARVDETGHARAAGFASVQQWLADRTKATPTEAARTIETGRYLAGSGGSGPELAATRAALAAGALTATQANEIASAASRAPDDQDRLLAFAARETTKQLRNECRAVRLARREGEEPTARSKRVKDEMAFGHREVGDGVSELFARMPTSWLALVLAAVKSQCEVVFAQARAEGRSDAHQVYMVEALVTLVLLGRLDGGGVGSDESHGDGDVEPEEDGDVVESDGDVVAEPDEPQEPVVGGAGPVEDVIYEELLAAIRGGPPPERPPRRVRRRRGRCRCSGRALPRAKILVRVDQAALLRGHAEPGELCDIAGVGPVPVATVRELWPDAVVKAIVTRGVDVVNVTSLGRRAIEAVTTAMQFTGGSRCSNLACDNDSFLQIDHRLGFSNVHRTRLDELDPLCTACHALKSNENWQLVAGTGRRRFVPPGSPDHPGDPPTMRRAG